MRAIAGLGRASRLALLGNCEDGLLMWSLVRLLEDDHPRVREAAFAALEKQVPDTFGYRPDLTGQQRRAVLGQRRQWCREKCGPESDPLPQHKEGGQDP